ncbi:MAG: hypothetical protein SOX66_04665 [Gemmiger qucibialis]|nr:hypothetical protein [Gemmiger qucibialis]
MANKHYTGTNTPQIKQLYPEWLYPDWMPWWEYREYKAAKFNELQEEKASAHRQKLERDQQAERHRAFEENARKHNIPIPKKKKELWED